MVMMRIFSTILATVICVAFVLSNTQHVEVSFVVGEPVETRLIFVLAISFGLGVLVSFFYRMVQEANQHLKHRKMRMQLKGGRKQLEHE